MCVCVRTYVCNCDNGFLCRNFQLPLLHFMGSLGFYSLGELQLLPLGSRHIRHVCAGMSPPLSLAPLPLRVMIMTSYNVKVVYRNFGFRSFLLFFISFEIELCVSSFNAEPCDSYANGVLLLGAGQRKKREG